MLPGKAKFHVVMHSWLKCGHYGTWALQWCLDDLTPPQGLQIWSYLAYAQDTSQCREPESSENCNAKTLPPSIAMPCPHHGCGAHQYVIFVTCSLETLTRVSLPVVSHIWPLYANHFKLLVPAFSLHFLVCVNIMLSTMWESCCFYNVISLGLTLP